MVSLQIAIPCRPRKTFTLYVLDVPEDLPVEDIRHAMYKFDSVVEVVRLHIYSSPSQAGGGADKVEGEQLIQQKPASGHPNPLPGQTLRRAAMRSNVQKPIDPKHTPTYAHAHSLARNSRPATNLSGSSSSAKSLVSSSAGGGSGSGGGGVGIVGEAIEKAERPERRELPPAVIRITLASMDEYNILLQNGLNFYDATFFPTEANISLKGAKIDYKRR